MAFAPFTFLGWNVGAAHPPDVHPDTRWDARVPQVLSLLQRADADIVALVELRDHGDLTWLRVLAALQKYDPVVRRYCHKERSMAACLLVDPRKFFVGDARLHSFEGTPRDDKILLLVDLQCKATGRWFTVGATHFAMDEPRKWRAAEKVAHLLAGQPFPTVIYGDFNFFEDKDGGAQRALMLGAARDLAHPLEHPLLGPKDPSGGPTLSGTFLGFPYDDHKRPWGAMSRLDHMFTQRGPHGFTLAAGPAVSPFVNQYGCDNTDCATYSYPSDHLAIMATISCATHAGD